MKPEQKLNKKLATGGVWKESEVTAYAICMATLIWAVLCRVG